MLASTGQARRAGRAMLCTIAATTVATATFAASATAAKRPKPAVKISVGDVTLYKVANDPPSIPDDIREKVMATLSSYISAAMVKPLQKGTADPNSLSSAFGPAVTARLQGPDRSILLDEGLPRAVRKIVVTTAPVALTGLANAQGNVILVTAAFDATTTTRTRAGKLTIKRRGELVLTPEAGRWKITGYTLTVDRVGKGLGDTTTMTAPTPIQETLAR
jgi:hypothetical protein